MPFIVVVIAPEFDELVQLNHFNGSQANTNNLENLKNICEKSSKFLSDSDWALQADLILINRNRDISLRRF
jgi:hypothetical protein